MGVEPSTDARFYIQFPDFIDWQAHIRSVADYWCHVLLYAPGYDIDIDTIGGWVGPKATEAEKRSTGMAWAMAQRFLGHGVWHPADRR